MTLRRTLLLLTFAALLGVFALRHADRPASDTTSRRASEVTPRATSATGNALRESPATTPVAGRVTRAEAVAYVRALYRQEQLTRELDLEQRRYGEHYWQTERSMRFIVQLQQAKTALLTQLAAEANQVLDQLFPDQTGEPLVFAAIFDADHPGPQLANLPAARRARFEAEALARGADRAANAEPWLEVATAVLSADELQTYRCWNEPAAAALRTLLAGFDATEEEFGAILRATRANAGEPESGIAVGLETKLGAARFAEWRASQEPALHTARQDLRRLDLPLDDAAWLAATRAQAAAAIQRTWRDAMLADAAKAQQVAQLERIYGRIIATKFALPEGSLDELGVAP